MKANHVLYLAAALISLLACNKNNAADEQDANKHFQEKSAIVSVIANLTGQKVDSFEGKTFTPTIGTVVVYTATPVPFNDHGVPPFEKVAI